MEVKLNKVVAVKIASVVWHEMGAKDVKDALQLARLVRSVDDVDLISRTVMKYKSKKISPILITRGN
jgi:hypothetical protein